MKDFANVLNARDVQHSTMGAGMVFFMKGDLAGAIFFAAVCFACILYRVGFEK